MPSTIDLKAKITSTNGTAKITKAMQLVSAVKMRKLQESFKESQYYVEGLKTILSNISSAGTEEKVPLLRRPEKYDLALIIVIGTSRGFVGSQISKLGSAVYELTNLLKSKNCRFEIMTVKNRALKLIARYGLTSLYHFDDDYEKMNPAKLTPLKQIIVDGFTSGKYDSVYIVYTEFYSTLVQKQHIRKFLPLEVEKIVESQEENHPEELSGAYLFEPDVSSILNRLTIDYVEVTLLNSILSATASEYSARMVAMQQASNNALEIADNLLVQYNKTRQSAITQQIQEIINANIN